MYWSGERTRGPSSTTWAPAWTFLSARFLVGSSSDNPFTNTTSAVVNSSATLGLGS